MALKESHITILGIETSCDETAAAVVTDGRQVRSSVVASQTALHQKYGGVVPEIASRAHIENLLPVLTEAMRQAGVGRDEIDAIAIANQPGLAIALVVGVTAAKTLSMMWASRWLRSTTFTRISSRRCSTRSKSSCRR
jgi:N6-L-threonylcarbamoyladenine synthase